MVGDIITYFNVVFNSDYLFFITIFDGVNKKGTFEPNFYFLRMNTNAKSLKLDGGI